MKFCPQCATPITHHIPPGDNKLRYCCLACDNIYYQNPNNIVGTLPVWQDKVLLCRRAIEPRKGLWTLPAGFMENGETTLEGAIRETQEEAGVMIPGEHCRLYSLYNLHHINQVYFFFLADMLSPDYAAGEESLEVALFDEDDIPWDNIAFAVVKNTLQQYFADRKHNKYPVRMFDVNYGEDRTVDIDCVSESER